MYDIIFQCESDLAEAIPALEAALAALNTLKVMCGIVDNLNLRYAAHR